MWSDGIISSDDHVMEPADLWTTRTDPEFRERALRIERFDNADWWVVDGVQFTGVAGGSQAGKRFEMNPTQLSLVDVYENVRPGGYIPEEHIKDLDIDGVDVSITYPTVGLAIYTIDDSRLLDALCRAYNDWLADFCNAFPKRLKGIAMLNVDDVQVAVKELERCCRMGLIGAMITVYPPQDRPYDTPEYEPLWAAAQDLEMPLSLHVASNRVPMSKSTGFLQMPGPAYAGNRDHFVRMSLGEMMLSGVFDRYPKLQVGSIEHEMGWVPHFLVQMDYAATQRIWKEEWFRFTDMRPSDYFHRNAFVGFQEDALGIRFRELIGVDNMLWGSDYPHIESTFPKSREILERILADCTEEEKAKIVGGNAARVYRLD